jgi:phenylalanyl-tRNA synthetase alpha chain
VEDKLSQVKSEYIEKINSATKLKALDEIFIELFGKNGIVTLIPKDFATLSPEEKKVVGPIFNQVKSRLEEEIRGRRKAIREASYNNLADEKLDLNAPAEKLPEGHLHPLTIFEKEIADLFEKIGFSQYDSPHIDSDEINFQLVNIPEDHPSRDLQDTLYIKTLSQSPGKLLLRTHTSNSQIRIMRDFKPAFRQMVIGRCFRFESLDARHEHTFDQFEIVYVDKDVSMANLQYLSEYFLQNVLGQDITVRLRPKYYPFVEPGAGVDGLCIFCKGEGCRICGGVGWLELGGAGMIHPVVLKNGGIDPAVYTGIAWGCSPDRMVMLKYGIEDIRDLRLYERMK